eukprot:GEMP01022127.1.p1 GENE.GEMP01022127.1~~GEMP01022127.1.p1  ORF type:complete len:294 (+),score=50.62 GEMP01022127.1:259-1140(+)
MKPEEGSLLFDDRYFFTYQIIDYLPTSDLYHIVLCCRRGWQTCNSWTTWGNGGWRIKRLLDNLPKHVPWPDREQLGADSRHHHLTVMTQAKISFYFMCGVVAYEKKAFSASIIMMRRILEIAPDHYDVECRLADTLYAMSNQGPDCAYIKEAKAIYDSVHARKPNYSYSVNGLALFAMDDAKRRKLLETAVELDTGNCYALANLGGHYLLCTDLINESHRLLEKALSINPNLFYARIHLSVALVRMGYVREAIKCLQLQMRMRPNDTKASSLLRLLTLQRNALEVLDEEDTFD